MATAAGFRAEGIEWEKLRYGNARYDVETHARLASDPAPAMNPVLLTMKRAMRHGAPVRNRHAVASTTVRRSTGGRPVDFTFGDNGPITARASSEITSRDTRSRLIHAAPEDV